MAGGLKNLLFANFVTSLAEERGKGQLRSVGKIRCERVAYRLTEGDEIEEVKPRKLRPGDRVVVKAGQVVPGDDRRRLDDGRNALNLSKLRANGVRSAPCASPQPIASQKTQNV
jgi:high-affinity K+ transport system ATPase subunit B